MPPMDGDPPVSTEQKLLMIGKDAEGDKFEAMKIFNDCCEQLLNCEDYPSRYGIELQDGMRMAYNILLGNTAELYSVVKYT